jgi:haloacetate dehalogenase
MTHDYGASSTRDQNTASRAANYSRRRLLLAGAATGLSLTVANEHVEAADAGAAKGEITQELFPGFATETVETAGATINVLRKGSGQPLLLLHGYPETNLTWHKVAQRLAEQYSVVVPDLRGYGNSGRPPDGERHEGYSFRAMAQDQVDVMRHYGHDQFWVVAHDRGARVTHRLCLDHPESVKRAVLMDIAPTLTMYEGTNQEFATKYMWWFFLIQSFPLPEHMIGLDPKFYLQRIFDGLNKTPGSIAPELMNKYIEAFANPATIHSTCEDFRAAAGADLEMDRADDKAGKKIVCPLHVLWAGKGTVGVLWDVLATWRAKCSAPVTGRAVDCGHFLQEEAPQDVLAESQQFFST